MQHRFTKRMAKRRFSDSQLTAMRYNMELEQRSKPRRAALALHEPLPVSQARSRTRTRLQPRARARASAPAPVPPPPHPGPYLGCADRVRVSVPRRRLGRAAAPHVGRLCRAVRHARPRAARRLGEGTAHYACTHYGSTTYYGASLHSPWSTIRYDCTYCRRSRPSPSP